MNFPNIIRFIKTTSGSTWLVIGLGLLSCLAGVLSLRQAPEGLAPASTNYVSQPVTTTVRFPARSTQPKPASFPAPVTASSPTNETEATHLVFPAAPSSSAPEGRTPVGQVLNCVLRFAVSTSNLETPLIGYVAEDVNYFGTKIIRKGAEVHGTARSGALRDRIYSNDDWLLILPGQPAQTIKVKAIALTAKPIVPGVSWDPYAHGTVGILGQRVEVPDADDWKRVVAAAAQAATEAVRSTRTTIGSGGVIINDVSQNAAVAAANAAVQQYVTRQVEAAPASPFMNVVPAGTPFLLYLKTSL